MPVENVRWLRLALKDMEEILDYLQARTDTETARSLAQRIWDASQSLTSLPGRGRPGKVPGTRELCMQNMPYFIVYRVKDGYVEIIRIIHYARDYSSCLDE